MTIKARRDGRRAPESMEEKIGLRLLAVGVAAMLVTALLTMVLFHRVLESQVRQDLAYTAGAVARAYQRAGLEGAAEIFADSETRVTLIAPDGDVLYESLAGAVEENHLSRPEVRQALAEGEGSAKRRSATSGYDTYYYAVRTDDGNVLRTALNARSFFSLYNEALPAAVLCLVLVLAMSAGAAVLLTKRIVGPIEQMGHSLSGGAIEPPYRELAPFAQAIEADRGSRDEAERMRREFTANVSHELKTPLTSISGYAELIETGLAKPEDVKGFAGRIKQESARLLALIGDILELSRLEGPAEGATARKFHPEPMDLGRAAEAVAQRLQLSAQKAYVTLLVDAAPGVGIYADARLIDELVQNLTDNAIRYNRPGGRVTLRVRRTQSGGELTVEDTGLGIPAEHQPHVFERFYRVDKSRSKATGGTGLGLAIVKHIALLHSADIHLASEEGKGTSITVTFPLEK